MINHLKSMLRISLLCLIVLFSFSPEISAQSFDLAKRKLEHYAIQSIKLRSQVYKTIEEHGMESAEMDSLDQRIANLDSLTLREIDFYLNEYGWLGKSLVGAEANQALFLLIQHAGDPEVRKVYLPLLKKSVDEGESNAADWATMLDRVLVDQGLPQKYGTQYRIQDGKKVYFPIEEEENLNKRRRSVGLKRFKK